mgnify:CR=1 FL=1
MKNTLFTFTATSLLYVSVALYAFVTGAISLAPTDPYALMAEASLKRSK